MMTNRNDGSAEIFSSLSSSASSSTPAAAAPRLALNSSTPAAPPPVVRKKLDQPSTAFTPTAQSSSQHSSQSPRVVIDLTSPALASSLASSGPTPSALLSACLSTTSSQTSLAQPVARKKPKGSRRSGVRRFIDDEAEASSDTSAGSEDHHEDFDTESMRDFIVNDTFDDELEQRKSSAKIAQANAAAVSDPAASHDNVNPLSFSSLLHSSLFVLLLTSGT